MIRRSSTSPKYNSSGEMSIGDPPMYGRNALRMGDSSGSVSA